MARGFESKSVEFQQEEAQRGKKVKAALTAEEKMAHDRRQGLKLARTRAAADLSRATAPAHRRMLEEALASLDARLAQLEAD
jgi:hypothetical protein